VTVALDLLGAYLVHEAPRGPQIGRVVETEAYVGPDDRASHASRGRTARTAPMFGPPGVAYVYLVYGMYYCLNAVTEPEGYPAAVLIRALEPLAGIDAATNGPGRLCRALGLDRGDNGADLTAGGLYFSAAARPGGAVVAAPRVGVDYAGAWALKPWRFYLAESRWVSRPPRRRGGARRAREATESPGRRRPPSKASDGGR
jgi:DNA-3-methyladenine glycosylase